jgi:uncharacterized OB-fold protein
MDGESVLTAPVTIEYPFRRTTGPVIGAFMTGLREGLIVGIRAADGRVLVPPQEYDPVTAEDLTEIVEVGSAGVVTTWCWIDEPLEGQPFDRPFAWAMVHALDTGGDQGAVSTGMRVQARWRPSRPADVEPDSLAADGGRYREGHILDIECFEPATGSAADQEVAR